MASNHHHNCVWLHLRNEDELAVMYKILRTFDTNLKVIDIVYSHSNNMPYHPVVYLRPPDFTDDMPLRHPVDYHKWNRIKRLMALSRKVDADELNREIDKQVAYQKQHDDFHEIFNKYWGDWMQKGASQL